MLQLTEVIGGPGAIPASAAWSSDAAPRISGTLTLTFQDRRRSRLLVRLDDGREVGLMLPRGTLLREGDLLRGEDPLFVVRVRAATETLSVARTLDALLLSRAAYHLGNRHVPLQIGPGWLAYQHDHVLDDLARALGLVVDTETAPFEPEAGGYSHQGAAPHPAGHGDGHGHGYADHAPGQAAGRHDHAPDEILAPSHDPRRRGP